jgi:hypothetical protein
MYALCMINVVRIWHMEGHSYVLSLNIVCVNFFELLNVESALLSAEVGYSVLPVVTNGNSIIVYIIL